MSLSWLASNEGKYNKKSIARLKQHGVNELLLYCGFAAQIDQTSNHTVQPPLYYKW